MVAIPVNPPWILPPPVVNLEVLDRLQKDRVDVESSDLFKRRLDTVHNDCVAIYTDGSKIQGQDALGQYFVVQECGVAFRKRITDHLAVYTAELMAKLFALQWMEEVKPDSSYLI